MRSTDNRIPVLAAVLMAFLLAVMPNPADAATAASSDASAFDSQKCMQDQRDALTQGAQDRTQKRMQVYNSATTPSMKLVYCFEQIKAVLNTIGSLTTSLNGNPFGFIWGLVMDAITSALNAACAAVVGAVTSAINMVKSLLCIPIPHFSLGTSFSLGSFGMGGGNCGGNSISLLGGVGTIGGTRPQVPGGWNLWNYATPTSP